MKHPLKPGDRILLSVLGVAVLLGLVWLGLSLADGRNSSANGMIVVTQTKGGFRRADPLGIDTEYTVETPGTGTGEDADEGLNNVRISGGRVDVVSANCSNQVCVGHEPIDTAGEQIVCLPHGMVVEVVADEADATTLQ